MEVGHFKTHIFDSYKKNRMSIVSEDLAQQRQSYSQDLERCFFFNLKIWFLWSIILFGEFTQIDYDFYSLRHISFCIIIKLL